MYSAHFQTLGRFETWRLANPRPSPPHFIGDATMASQTTATKKSRSKNVDEQERLQMIAEAAYLRAEARGFGDSQQEADWLAAEAEVDAHLGSGK